MRDIEKAAALLTNARHGVALTGAGISTESGLPDFRSPGGLWAGIDPFEVATRTAFRRTPEKFYDFYRARLATLALARPNPAHYALADLEAREMVAVVLTQNIDGLHQAAGSRRVIELHGNLREAACPDCGWIGPIEVVTEALAQERLPSCDRCGGRVKPNVVLFEEMLPVGAYNDAEHAVRSADVLLVVGSSLQVTPAAALPAEALRAGASLIIVNDESTPFDDVASVVLRGRAGHILPLLAHESVAKRSGVTRKDV